MQVASLDELRAALRTATPGDTIDLAPGEYQGPLLIDTSLTLRGLNRKTVVWRRGGPVIYTRAPDINLKNLLLERTVSQGPLIVHKAGCAPNGGESITLDALISLGDLAPGSSLTLPLDIETTSRAEIAVSGLYGAEVSPTAFEAPGSHLAWLTLDGNAVLRGEVLLGELTVRENGSTRYIWLSGNVLDAPPTDHPACLASKKIRLYPSLRGLLLNKALLSRLDNQDHGELADSAFAYVQRDSAGLLFLYLPTDAPVSLNGKAVPRWSRVLLRDKDAIQIGGATLNVVPAEAVNLRIEPAALALPDFAVQFPEPAMLTLQNLGKAAWKGRVMPVANWINVTPDGDFRMPATRSNQWSVQMNAEALALPNGAHDIIGGLLVASSNQVIGVDVRVTVRRPDIALQVAPLDAGSVEWGWVGDHVLDVPIGNLGRGTWTGTVRSSAPWLTVVTPMPITCGPWSESVIKVKVTPDWENLPVGGYDLPTGLLIDAPETPIPVRLQVTPPLPHLIALAPLAIFDQVERNAPLPDITLQVHNEGAAPWSGTIRAANGWVRLSPAEITAEEGIAPGATLDLVAHLLDVPAELALDTPILIDEIRFETGDPAVTTLAVGVQLTVVELPPFLVAGTVSFGPFVKGDNPPDGLLRIYNNGPARWRGNLVANSPWLNVPDGVFTCEPGTSIELYVGLNGKALDALKPGLTVVENALSVTGAREPVTISIQVDLRDTISELHLETPTLNFGQIDGAAPELPSLVVRLVNAGPAASTAKVEVCVPWLSIPGAGQSFDLSVPGMNIAEFSVALNEKARWLPVGVTFEERALLITGREKQAPICALLLLNDWSPQLSITPEKLTLTGDAPQTITLRNTGQQAFTAQIMPAAWLQVTPVELSLEPAQDHTVEVKKNPDLPPGKMTDSRAIVITAVGREFEIEVTLAESTP